MRTSSVAGSLRFAMIAAFLLCGGPYKCASFQAFGVRNVPYLMSTKQRVGAADAGFMLNTRTCTSISHALTASASDTSQQEEATLLSHDNPQKLSFVSQAMQLYIEDTDAYGVMYNGNYIKSYERALHEFHTQTTRKRVNGGDKCPQSLSSVLLCHSDFYLNQCTGHKFKASPPLGSQYVIQGTMVNTQPEHSIQNDENNNSCNGLDVDAQEETWSLEMVEYKDQDKEHNDEKPPKIYNTAIVTISTPTKKAHYITPFYAKETEPRLPMLTKSFTMHRDEFDVHMPGAIPIQTTLNLFERVRSDALGGPERLRQMQEDDNLLWVVTSIDDLQIDTRKSIRPGDDVLVSMYCTVKRKGMIIVIEQEILGKPHSDSQNNKSGIDVNGVEDMVVLAKGTVTICAIDSIRGRPTSNIPSKVKALFQYWFRNHRLLLVYCFVNHPTTHSLNEYPYSCIIGHTTTRSSLVTNRL